MLILVGVLLLLLALEFPVAFAMTGASAVYILAKGGIYRAPALAATA